MRGRVGRNKQPPILPELRRFAVRRAGMDLRDRRAYVNNRRQHNSHWWNARQIRHT